MFKFFSGTFNIGTLSEIGEIVQSFLETVDVGMNELSDDIKNKEIEETINSFIKFDQDEDMYLLRIDLKGIDLRELSIRYNPGVIDINVKRTEMENTDFGYFMNNSYVKKSYHKDFKGIEEIDTTHLLKTIDNGILKIRMPKKYVLNSSSKVVDVKYTVVKDEDDIAVKKDSDIILKDGNYNK